MKVQTKIALLLGAIVVAFLAGLWAFNLYDRAKFRRITEQRLHERMESFDEFLSRYGESVQTLAEYDSSWDQMVQAIAARDLNWFNANLNRETLEGYNVNAAWIYAPDGSPVYHVDNISAPDLADVPIPREALRQIFASDHFAHFFANTATGMLEIRAATVHPSKDFQRDTPARGFLLVGRLWSKVGGERRHSVLDEMQMFTGNAISFAPPNSAQPETRGEEESGTIAFTRPLNGWDGRPVAQLVVRNDSPVVQELNRASQRMVSMFFAFALVLLLVISAAVFLWINRPLRKIMESLTRNDLKPVEQMAQEKTEFGALARTIHRFFEQNEKLIREMKERRATEEALRRSEAELRHSQKMEAIGRLAGGVAHDFNNLLTAIIGYAELISTHDDLDPQLKQNAELILKAGAQAAMLTKQLLAFSRKQMMQPRVINLNQLILEMEILLRRVIGERFQLVSKAEAKDGRVRADPSQVEQVILNLGVNARDAMPTGGTLVIRTANVHLDEQQARVIGATLSAGDYVELCVSDTGTGMDEETMLRIFEPFFTTKGPGKGTGLGLATVYGIVRQSGGAITVESELGKGSTFRIYLPRETAPVEATKGPELPARQDNNSETVLVVEDETIVRDLVCDVLQRIGYSVFCAQDGRAALELARNFTGKIDLLITDVIMPEMNGHDLARHLGKSRPDTKVLYVSGYSDSDIIDHGRLDPRFELLQKPFTPQTLARKVREVMQNGALTAALTE